MKQNVHDIVKKILISMLHKINHKNLLFGASTCCTVQALVVLTSSYCTDLFYLTPVSRLSQPSSFVADNVAVSVCVWGDTDLVVHLAHSGVHSG